MAVRFGASSGNYHRNGSQSMLPAVGAILTAGSKFRRGTCDLTGVGMLQGSPARRRMFHASLAATGAIAVTSTVRLRMGALSLTGQGQMTGLAQVERRAAAGLPASGGITAVAARSRSGAANPAATGAMTATGGRKRAGGGAFPAVGTLSAVYQPGAWS